MTLPFPLMTINFPEVFCPRFVIVSPIGQPQSNESTASPFNQLSEQYYEDVEATKGLPPIFISNMWLYNVELIKEFISLLGTNGLLACIVLGHILQV